MTKDEAAQELRDCQDTHPELTDVLRELEAKARDHANRAKRLGPCTAGKVEAHVASSYEDAADLVQSVLNARLKAALAPHRRPRPLFSSGDPGLAEELREWRRGGDVKPDQGFFTLRPGQKVEVQATDAGIEVKAFGTGEYADAVFGHVTYPNAEVVFDVKAPQPILSDPGRNVGGFRVRHVEFRDDADLYEDVTPSGGQLCRSCGAGPLFANSICVECAKATDGERTTGDRPDFQPQVGDVVEVIFRGPEGLRPIRGRFDGHRDNGSLWVLDNGRTLIEAVAIDGWKRLADMTPDELIARNLDPTRSRR